MRREKPSGMFLMFGLARPDVFSFGDLVLRQELARLYPGQDHPAVVRAWSPQRTLAARVLWAGAGRRRAEAKARAAKGSRPASSDPL